MLTLCDRPRTWKIRKEWLFYSEDQCVDKILFSVFNFNRHLLIILIVYLNLVFTLRICVCMCVCVCVCVWERERERERQTVCVCGFPLPPPFFSFHYEEFHLNWYCASICMTVLELNPLFGNNFLHVLKLQTWHESITKQQHTEHLAVGQTVYWCKQILLCWKVKFKTCKPRAGVCSLLLHIQFTFST